MDYRFGFDDRFSSDGTTLTRTPGEFLAALTPPDQKQVLARSLLANPEQLRVAGMPLIVRPLAAESLLLDEDNAGLMAAGAGAAGTSAKYAAAVQGFYLLREEQLQQKTLDNIAKIKREGVLPSPIAWNRWQDPIDPVLLDTNYSHPHSAIKDDWVLDPDRIECTLRSGVEMSASVVTFEERTRINYSVIKTLKSQPVGRVSIGPTGQITRTQAPPKGLDESSFDALDVVSAPLSQFDPQLITSGLLERAGHLYLNTFDLLDTYGFARNWNRGEGIDAITLNPRLPYWARLLFRLQSVADKDSEATVTSPPVIGILLPDFLEHALEIYDQNGTAIGQITSPRPVETSAAGPSLQASFEVHPWVAAALKMVPGEDPLDAIAHPTLRALVAAIVSYKTDVVAAASTQWYESALTAFLRVIDTIRGTLDPSKRTPDSKAKLIGESILVMRARLRLEGTTAEPKDLVSDVPTLADNPALPTIPVRIGDVTRPDDGVLGCFEIGASPDSSVFVPVSRLAADQTILNQLSEIASSSFWPAVHPFIAQDRDTTFELNVGEQLDLVILADPRGGLYATSGALPRKKITLPAEFLRAALSNLEPTFSIGPILATGKDDFVRALIPPPRLNGMDAEFLYRRKSEDGSPDSFPSTPLTPVPPTAELPIGRATLAEGWARVFQKKE